MLFLNVPYAEKDEARELGARWDAESKRWYVPKGQLATPFERWMRSCDAGKLLRAQGTKGKRAGPLERAPRRPDDAVGIVIVGINYAPVEGATGLPWAV